MSSPYMLENLFNYTIKYYKKLRQNNSNLDGKKAWEHIKEILASLDNIKGKKYKKLAKKLKIKIKSYPEYDATGKMIESNHFIIQQERIPATEEITIRKIIQIALNIGQWKGMPNKQIYKELEYDNTGLDKISTYVSVSDIKKLSKYLTYDIVQKIEAQFNL